jgi:hypothetical protein
MSGIFEWQHPHPMFPKKKKEEKKECPESRFLPAFEGVCILTFSASDRLPNSEI